MSVEAVRAVLVASGAVTALVPASRIQVLMRTQGLGVPAITLQRVATTPFNHLRGNGALDANLVQIDFYGTNYTDLRTIANTARQALEAVPNLMSMQSEIDRYESETDPELYHLMQTWSVFT